MPIFLFNVHFVLLKSNQISTDCLFYRLAHRKLYGKFNEVGVYWLTTVRLGGLIHKLRG